MDTELEVVEVEGAKYVPAVALALARNVPRETVYMAVRANRLPSARHLGRMLIPLSDAEKWFPQGHGGDRKSAKRKAQGNAKSNQ